MKQIILNVLCEGTTEERFAQKVLKQYLKSKVIVKTQILATNVKKDIRGGMISYEQVKRDLQLWIKGCKRNNYETHYYTTMFDLYALPKDFPGYADADKIFDCYNRVQLLESEFAKDFSTHGFIPYIQLHEFEALVFCGLDYLQMEYPDMRKQINNLKKTLIDYSDNPEEINNSSNTAPSKRIMKEFDKVHHYNKPELGVFITSKVGIEGLKARCRHFNEWIEKLEKLS